MVSIGVLLAVLSGVANGLFTAPMKLEKRWKWENIWFVFIVTACLAMPWAVVEWGSPGYSAVYVAAPTAAVAAACVFGFAWGFGAICFGRSVDALGVSLSNSLVLGVSSALGSLVPLVMTHPAVSATSLALLFSGIAAFLVGVALCGAAGRARDAVKATKTGVVPLTGYTFAIVAGVMSAVFNIGYTLALPVADAGMRLGYSQTAATNTIWLLMLGAGSLPNLVYCGWLMRRHESARLLWQAPVAAAWTRAIAMGLLWGGSIFLYGAATPKLGRFGPSVGWPLSLAVGLLVANLMGLLLGEWRGTSALARRRMYAGIATLLVAITLCSLASGVGA
jgi:L-rhamnose-H+ transport protein